MTEANMNTINAINAAKTESATVHWLKSVFSLGKRSTTTANTPEIVTKQSTPVARKNKTVLVVDDDPVFLKATSMRLESEGYDVLTANEGSEAIQQARKKRPDAMVLDIDLSRDISGVPWDGFTVIEWLNRFDNLKTIPVVIATNGDASKYSSKAFKSGATAFFHKRMEAGQLVTLVERSINHPRPKTETAESTFQI